MIDIKIDTNQTKVYVIRCNDPCNPLNKSIWLRDVTEEQLVVVGVTDVEIRSGSDFDPVSSFMLRELELRKL